MRAIYKLRFRFLSGLVALIATSSFSADLFAQGHEEGVTVRWQKFQSDPRSFMSERPLKRDRDGKLVPPLQNTAFSEQEIRSGDFVSKKARLRSEQIENSIKNRKRVENPRFAHPSSPSELLDHKELEDKNIIPIHSLFEMEKLGLLSGEVTTHPWSGSYWPIYQGTIGARYASDDFFNRRSGWKSYFEYTHGKAPLNLIYKSADAKAINELSPSEKYDLLIGNLTYKERSFDHGYLTPAVWAEGEYYHSQYGKVEEWMGLCHGWAAASFEVPRPTKTVNTLGADQKTQLMFYPADIKGLVTYLWSKVPISSTFIGGRCDDKNPKRDPETGRVISEKCFDTNPAIWHFSVINQIGLVKRPFVMDATFDYEVWNQPVFAYKYKYFNPETGAASEKIEDAIVAYSKFQKDKFKKYRSPNTAYVVGIEMEVTYGLETGADHSETDGPEFDSYNSATYMYDLELNANKDVIGGEWYTNGHPDFAWLPYYKQRPLSAGDRALPNESWKPDQPLPDFWKQIAIVTAVKYGHPLANILEGLVENSSGAERQ